MGHSPAPDPRLKTTAPLVGRRPPVPQAVLVVAPVPVQEGVRPRTPAAGRTEVQPGAQRQRGAVASIGRHLDEVGRRLPPPSTVGPGRQGRERTHAQASSVAAPATPDEVPADEPSRVRTAITAGRGRRPRAELAGGPRSARAANVTRSRREDRGRPPGSPATEPGLPAATVHGQATSRRRGRPVPLRVAVMTRVMAGFLRPGHAGADRATR